MALAARSYTPYIPYSSTMDIVLSHFSREPDARCAFPSWPRGDSLCSYAGQGPATSYLSDEDLAGDVSSNGISTPITAKAEILEMQREQAAYQREVARFLKAEKERRRQRAVGRPPKRGKQGKSKSELSVMVPIAEDE